MLLPQYGQNLDYLMQVAYGEEMLRGQIKRKETEYKRKKRGDSGIEEYKHTEVGERSVQNMFYYHDY
jgi:hypothetical protein